MCVAVSYRQARSRFLAAAVSSGLQTGVVEGEALIFSGLVLASSAISIIASINESIVSLLSVSVGSIIIASWTVVGK